MVLELHIWGPAFSLPSIDPQCLAAIVYLQQVVPRDEWELIASCDDALSPTRSSPRLILQQRTWGLLHVICQLLIFP